MLTGDPAMRAVVRSVRCPDGVTTSAGVSGYAVDWVQFPDGVHHSLVGMAAGALAAGDADALTEVLQQCGRPTLRAVCLYAERDGRVLAVSRKNDRRRFGLPGGKVDPGETEDEAIVREVREETGLELSGHRPVFEKLCWGSVCYVSKTYVGNLSGDVHTDEPVDVVWATHEVLLEGPFGDYNRRLFRRLGVPE